MCDCKEYSLVDILWVYLEEMWRRRQSIKWLSFSIERLIGLAEDFICMYWFV
ncbi:hypothetical protein [Clostridium saccharoperbutylacetonicum]|uniref:hypothetical protein n=1 Tax=Clostridium saccharoperbutylacetonicum TaxID=36745 RepID=UPI0039EB9219